MANIIVKPVITEKSSALMEDMGRFTFIVDNGANKIQIKEAIETRYSVTVEEVNTMRYAGKKKTRATKSAYVTGKTASYKKAIVTLAEGETIDIYENI